MRKNCDIVKDLIPTYVENLTSEESNQFIERHLNDCQDCTNYLMNVERDLPKDSGEVEMDKSDQQIVKGIQKKVNRMTLFAILIGVLIGIYGSMMFFNMNEFQSILIIYPIATFLIGFLSYILFKNIWIGPVATLVGGLFSVFIFVNITFLTWMIVYTAISLLGSLIGKGVIYFFNRKKLFE
ncbi:DUF2651 family protein [Oceanobacillus halotolerans]|uniref:DUF2651 family protein n=1 Tax=Oceanobacillus halotolerans TaxID=2663380 RepID=UPI0013D95042|nr:DUF2651 family protein [Oceanobacillus halotolerans]